MDEAFIVKGEILIIVKVVKRLKAGHFEDKHTQSENIGFRRYIGIKIILFHFLYKRKGTFKS